MTDLKPINGWKKLALRSLFIGVGIAVTLSIFAGAVIWYASRPTPSKPWNSHAIVANDTPGFWTESWVSNDGKTTVPIVVLQYTLENTTSTDYTIDSRSALKFVLRFPNGAITPNLFSDESGGSSGYRDDISLPVFIPAKQKSLVRCHFSDTDLPSKNATESDADYHERLRAYLDKTYKISGLVIFDDVNHYEIELPKWASKRP